jgi:hypothetical protein
MRLRERNVSKNRDGWGSSPESSTNVFPLWMSRRARKANAR